MGATLPAIARLIESTPSGVSWLGFFYGGNIAGAVLGSLFAGFYLLRGLRHGDRDLRRRRN
jgi:spermidine synthase